MMHVGLICPPVSGHLNPMTTLGRELRRRGHRVTLIGIADAEARARAAGLEYAPIGLREQPCGTVLRLNEELGRLHGLAAVRFTLAHFVESAEVLLREGPAVIRSTGIQGLLIDQTSAGGGVVAEHLRLPYVTVCCALAINAEPDVPPLIAPWGYARTPLARLRNRLGYGMLDRLLRPIGALLNARRSEWGLPKENGRETGGSHLAQVAQQPSGFDFPRRHLPPQFHHCGPFHDGGSEGEIDFPWDRLDGRPLIYASLGTLQNRLDPIFRAIAQACAGLDAQLVLSLGSRDRRPPAELPGSPLVVPFAPQLRLLERASLVITHAGLNTTLESLSRGVPLVAIPITNDQPGVAARIAYSGTGEVVPLTRATPRRLRTAIRRVLAEPRYRAQARRLQEEIRSAEGIRRAVDVSEEALRSGRPVHRSDGGPHPARP